MTTHNRLTTHYNAISTDAKPDKGMRNGDTIYFMDSRQLYMFDEEHSLWHLLPFSPQPPDKGSAIVGKGRAGYMKVATQPQNN